MTSRIDIIEERKAELKNIANDKTKRLEKFYRIVELIKLNEDTKYFFELAYELYGRDVIEQMRKATTLTPTEKDFLLGKFDLLNQLIIPFINKI